MDVHNIGYTTWFYFTVTILGCTGMIIMVTGTQRISLSLLTFTASYQTGDSYSQPATCSLLPDLQYNCTTEFAVDIIPSVDTIQSVNVTVSGPYGSASSSKSINQSVDAIFSVSEVDITENSVTLICKLPCFTTSLQWALTNLMTNGMKFDCVSITNNVTGSVMAYTYPTQTITLSGLNSGRAYSYCVVATNGSEVTIGVPVCGNFTTQMIISETKDDSLSTEATVVITFVITFIVTLIIATVITFTITYICVKQKYEKILRHPNRTVLYEQVGPSNQTSTITENDLELQPNPAYGTSHKVNMDINPAYESCK